jgi:hypothetical protein
MDLPSTIPRIKETNTSGLFGQLPEVLTTMSMILNFVAEFLTSVGVAYVITLVPIDTDNISRMITITVITLSSVPLY